MENEKVNKYIMLPVVMLSMALALRQMSMTIVAPFISTYCGSLIGNTPLLAGLAVGIFGLMQAVFQIPYGMLSDRYGNKKIVIIGLTQVVAGLVIAYFSKSIVSLIFARALQGSGAIIGVGYSWVAGMADDSNRTKAMSILGGFVSAAAAIAFAVGPLLRNIMTVNWMFMASAILIFINELYILFFLKDTDNGSQKKLLQSKEIGILLKDKTFVIMNLAAFFNNFMMMAVFYAAPIYIDKVTGQEGMWKIFVPAIVIAVLVMRFVAKWADKGFFNLVMIIAFFISSFGILFYFNNGSYIFLLLGTTIFMCGYISLATIVATNVNNIVGETYRGTANGIFNSFQYIGNFAGAIIMGYVWGISQKLAWIIVISIGLAGLLMIALGRPSDRKIYDMGVQYEK